MNQPRPQSALDSANKPLTTAEALQKAAAERGKAPHSAAAVQQTWLHHLPMMAWVRQYDRSTLTSDMIAAIIVTIMLIPQSLAYAMLAGLPAQIGLYASMAPLLAYALLGSSRVLAVGPVAVVSLMTAESVGRIAVAGSTDYWQAAMALALLSGVMLVIVGVLRLGKIANFLSHPVISGFISASGILIAFSQLKHLLGVKAEGSNLLELCRSLWQQINHVNGVTLGIGTTSILVLFFVRSHLLRLLVHAGMRKTTANFITKAGPVAVIAVTTLLVWLFQLDKTAGVKIVGAIPSGLPPLALPAWNPALWQSLLAPAALISLVGFVESISVGQTLAAKRRQRIQADQELVALGASNLASALCGGFPVTGGFARSVVNFDAGAQTPAAGVYTAVGIAVASLLLTPALYYLPQATLAATIVVAVLSLVDMGSLRRTWNYSHADGFSILSTLLVTLGWGVEVGLATGVAVSLMLHLYRSSHPHIAVVGLVPHTEHFRNVQRYKVLTHPSVLSLRVDESLYFANARYLEDFVNQAVAAQPELKHVVLQCSAINSIDSSALESIETIAERLHEVGIALHLSEVKGPVMDRLQTTPLLTSGACRVFLTHYQAILALTPEVMASSLL